jgi:hypothetical protein
MGAEKERTKSMGFRKGTQIVASSDVAPDEFLTTVAAVVRKQAVKSPSDGKGLYAWVAYT